MHGTPYTTPHPTCTRYCLGSSSASLVSDYEFLSGLILGSEYGQERWLTYMRAYSPRWNLNSVLARFSMNVSIKISRTVCPAIELFFRVQTRLGQWFSRELIQDECIRTRLTFAAQLIWVRCSDQIANSWDKNQLSGVSVDVSFSSSSEARSRVQCESIIWQTQTSVNQDRRKDQNTHPLLQ